MKRTIATPSFNVDSPNTKLNNVSSTCIDSITAITATGSTALARAAKVSNYELVKLLVNTLDDPIYNPPITNVDIRVPTTAYVTISPKLVKNACLFKKYVASYMMTGTNI